ncbi:MAG: NlpC/P60 family protein [Anaerolineaceae bacterium]
MDCQTTIENAIKWAGNKSGSDEYPFLCLAFVEDAYEMSNQIEIFGGDSAKESADKYGVQLTPEIPPAGAFVFYDCSGSIEGVYKNWGHVGLSCGEGKVLHAWDVVREDDYMAVEKLSTAEGWTSPIYIGWAPVERILQGYRQVK